MRVGSCLPMMTVSAEFFQIDHELLVRVGKCPVEAQLRLPPCRALRRTPMKSNSRSEGMARRKSGDTVLGADPFGRPTQFCAPVRWALRQVPPSA